MTNTVTFPGLGLSFEINRIAFSIGGINIYWYGLLIAVGLMLAIGFAFRHCQEFGVDPDAMIDVIVVGTVMAIVCARAYYVAMAPFRYNSIWEMLAIRDGGLAIYGGLIGAFVFGGLACKWRGVPVLPMFDMAGMGFLIGQCIGRWGNFVNQEAFGYNTALPWGMYSEGTRNYLMSSLANNTLTVPAGVSVDPSLPVHPTFLYESLWCLVGFILLFCWYKRRRFNGEIALLYAIWYGAGRFWIESLRTDSLLLVPSLNLRASQLVAAVTVVAALVLEIVLARKNHGRPLLVQLAVNSENRALRKQVEKKTGRPAEVHIEGGEAYAALPRAEFLRRTEAYNKALREQLKAQLDAA